MNNIIESQVFSGELYVKASDHHRAVGAAFEAGKAAAFAQAAHTIGIDTSDGMHTVTVFRMLPGQPTVLVASARLSVPEGDDWK